MPNTTARLRYRIWPLTGSRRFPSVLATVVLLQAIASVGAVEGIPAQATEQPQPEGAFQAYHPLDPSAIVVITLETGSPRYLYNSAERVNVSQIPNSGVLKIDFDRRAMADRWEQGTEASISIGGRVVGRDSSSRRIEVPGYSVIGDSSSYTLNVRSASTALQLMAQGGRFAHRIKGFWQDGQLAAVNAKLAVVGSEEEKLRAAFAETRRVLNEVYAAALTFTLTRADVERAAAELAAARSEVSGVRSQVEEAGKAGINTFFGGLATQIPSITAWLGQIQAEENEQLLRIISEIVGRSSAVMITNVNAIQDAFVLFATGNLTPVAQETLLRSLLVLADEISRLEQDIFYYYPQLPLAERERLVRERQIRAELSDELRDSNLDRLVYFGTDIAEKTEKAYRDSLQRVSICGPEPTPKSVDLDSARTLVEQFMDELRQRTGVSLTGLRPNTQFLERDFQTTLDELRSLQTLSNSLRAQKYELECRQKLQNAVVQEYGARYAASVTAVELLLLQDIIARLIRNVPPTNISLTDLGLNYGDRLILEINTIPAPAGGLTGQRPFEFEVVPSGFSGPFPAVYDALVFARASKAESDFSFRPGVLAMWNYYGNSKAWRTVAPGIGIGAIFLDFGAQTELPDGTVVSESGDVFQFGLGLTAGLFNNLLTGTAGWNLTASAKLLQGNGTGPPVVMEETRFFWAVGFSIRGLASKFQ